MSDKFYFSRKSIEDCIWDGSETMSLFFVPKKWWSIEHWKLAIEFKNNFTIMGILNDKNIRENGGEK